MRTTFYTLALLGAAAVNAVPLGHTDYSFAQTYAYDDAKATSLAEGSADSKSRALVATELKAVTDAECQVLENGVVMQIQSPECQLKKVASADQLILGAVSQLGAQAKQLE